MACVVFLPPFGSLIAKFCVTFEGRGPGSWYRGFLFGADKKDVPIGNPFMLHKFSRDRARCPRHTTQDWGERTPREREGTHTKETRGDYKKGNRTECAERTDRVEWRTSERG